MAKNIASFRIFFALPCFGCQTVLKGQTSENIQLSVGFAFQYKSPFLQRMHERNGALNAKLGTNCSMLHGKFGHSSEF